MTIYQIYNRKELYIKVPATGSIIPIDPDNTDYQNFKAQINDESAQLEDSNGVLMSAEDAKAYVATLP